MSKPLIVLTSLGRTGTKFFSHFLQSAIVDCTALHEPDVLDFNLSKGKGLRNLIRQLQESGFANLLLRKLFGNWSLVKLSDRRLTQTIDEDECIKLLQRQRTQFIASKPGKVYAESSIGYYGLLDLVPKLSPASRAVYIVRDGRDWVRSNMDWGEFYGKGPIRSRLAHAWPTAQECTNDIYAESWPQMTHFERLCWAWSTLNSFGIKCARKNPAACIVRFEDLFGSQDRVARSNALLDFLTDLPGVQRQNINLESWLERRIHAGSGAFPSYDYWTAAQKAFFHKMCSPLMQELEYK